MPMPPGISTLPTAGPLPRPVSVPRPFSSQFLCRGPSLAQLSSPSPTRLLPATILFPSQPSPAQPRTPSFPHRFCWAGRLRLWRRRPGTRPARRGAGQRGPWRAAIRTARLGSALAGWRGASRPAPAPHWLFLLQPGGPLPLIGRAAVFLQREALISCIPLGQARSVAASPSRLLDAASPLAGSSSPRAGVRAPGAQHQDQGPAAGDPCQRRPTSGPVQPLRVPSSLTAISVSPSVSLLPRSRWL